MEDGFYQTPADAKPFRAQALADVFARAQPADFLANQQAVLAALWAYCPGQLRSAVWAMDSVHFRVPRGAHTPEHTFKACVLGVWQDDVVWPLLWRFVDPDVAEITVGRQLVADAEAVLGAGAIQHLLVDRGYLDGAWLTALHARGTRVTVGVREDMLHLSQLPDATWEDAAADIATWNQGPPPLPPPERELAVYAGPYFALLLPSELVAIILTHMDAWQANRAQLLMALRLTEGIT